MYIEKVRGLLAAVQLNSTSDAYIDQAMLELERLADTAGVTVIQRVVQKRDRIEPATYFGKGKINEIKHLVSTHSIELVIINDSLSPVQIRNLENEFDVRVIDRTQLILDIFAIRASTRESKLQVELAQYQYLLPRLAGIGKQLSRLGGGIGTRGPGETKLETDRRKIRDRMADLRTQIEHVKKQRALQQKRRKKDGAIQVILTGYTNAGKSSLLNRLTNAEVLEEDRLFATLDPTMRKMVLPCGVPLVLIDTVGFIQQLPTQLIAAFRSTLEIVSEADLILHVIDSSDSDYLNKIEVVENLLRELGAITIPRIEVYNKRDLLIDDTFRPRTDEQSILISTNDADDLQKLIVMIERKILDGYHIINQKIPFTNPQQKAKIYAESYVIDESLNKDEGVWEIVGLYEKQ